MRHNGEESLFIASGKTPEDAVTVALELWPQCSECNNGVPEGVKADAWPVCGQCPEVKP